MNDHSLKSPLGKVKGLGSAKNGTHHWWMQRLTAIALIPLTIYFLVGFLSHIVWGNGYGDATSWLSSPFNGIVMLLLVFSGCYHANSGLQVIIEDYLHCEAAKITGIIIVKFSLVVLAMVGALSVIKIMLGV